MGDLDGVWIKIARAREHMEESSELIESFRNSRPYTFSSEFDAQTGDQVWKVDSDPFQPPSWPVIGDILYNFRSALDHLAWQLVLKANGAPDRGTEFPIFNDPDLWKRDSPRDMRSMNGAMKDMLKSEQPCFGPNPHRNKLLWGLQEYGNIDKHRLPLIVACSSAGMFWSPTGPSLFVHEGPVQKDTILARFPASYPKDEISTVVDVAFGEPPAFGDSLQFTFIGIEMNVTRIVERFQTAFF